MKIEEASCPLPKSIRVESSWSCSVYCFFILYSLLTELFDEGYHRWYKGIPADEVLKNDSLTLTIITESLSIRRGSPGMMLYIREGVVDYWGIYRGINNI